LIWQTNPQRIYHFQEDTELKITNILRKCHSHGEHQMPIYLRKCQNKQITGYLIIWTETKSGVYIYELITEKTIWFNLFMRYGGWSWHEQDRSRVDSVYSTRFRLIRWCQLNGFGLWTHLTGQIVEPTDSTMLFFFSYIHIQ
jgi:hypothetical protein